MAKRKSTLRNEIEQLKKVTERRANLERRIGKIVLEVFTEADFYDDVKGNLLRLKEGQNPKSEMKNSVFKNGKTFKEKKELLSEDFKIKQKKISENKSAKKEGRPSRRPPYQELVRLSEEEGMQTRDLAKHFGVQPSTIRAWRCLKRQGKY